MAPGSTLWVSAVFGAPEATAFISFENVTVQFAKINGTAAESFTRPGPSSYIYLSPENVTCEAAGYNAGNNSYSITSCGFNAKHTLLAAASVVVPVDVGGYTVQM
jgi:hypothetical protein